LQFNSELIIWLRTQERIEGKVAEARYAQTALRQTQPSKVAFNPVKMMLLPARHTGESRELTVR
jgi:hypothetical protein